MSRPTDSPLRLRLLASRQLLRWLPAVVLLLPAAARAELRPGDPFPAFPTREMVGSAIPPTTGKVLLVDFWASWCGPCKSSFPVYAKLQEDYRDRGLVIVAVSEDESQAAYAGFLARQRPSFAAPRDAAQELVRAVRVPTMPTCYLVGRDGRVRFVHAGFRGAETERELHREIELLLRETTPPS
jgi:thiol-disulfide isomerase/thioredoxin